MFADKQVRKKLSVFLDKVGETARWLSVPPPLPPRDTTCPEWCIGFGAGLGVDIGHFSGQLQRLQNALQPENYRGSEKARIPLRTEHPGG